MIRKRYYMTFIILNVVLTGLFHNMVNSNVISDPIKQIEFNFIFFHLHAVLLSLTFFYLIKRPKEEASSIACAIGLFEIYSLLTDVFHIMLNIRYFELLIFMENIIFLLGISYQVNKKYDIKSDDISKTTVCLIFYIPQTFKQYINSLFGLSYASVGAIIGNNRYNLVYGKSTVQENKVYIRHIKKHYLVIDTGVPIAKVKKAIPELLRQRARQKETLYLRYNCLRSLRPIINLLGKDWEYKGEIFPSKYLRRVLEDGKRKKA